MNCWDILCIEPGVDRKSIKLAYSKLLKKTKPDDDPEGFVKLHDAYKQALAISKRTASRTQQSASPSLSEENPDCGENQAPGTEIPRPEPDSHSSATKQAQDSAESPEANYSSVSEHSNDAADPPEQIQLPEPRTVDALPNKPVQTIIAEPARPTVTLEDALTSESNSTEESVFDLQSSFEKDWEVIERKVAELISTSAKGSDVHEWQFLRDIPSMIDLHFRNRVSSYLFDEISESNMRALKLGRLQITPPVLRYLNDDFHWDSRWQELEAEFGTERTNAICQHLNYPVAQPRARAESLFYMRRILAFAIDLTVVIACFFIQYKAASLAFLLSVGFAYLLVGIPLMEASRWQGSVGKLVTKLVVVDRYGLRIRWYHSLLRTWISVICILGFKVTIWINMFTTFKYNLLLQDLMTRSYVVSRDEN